jgi:hypothetical protein
MNNLEKIALEKYPVDEFWIGSGSTSRLYDQNLRDRNKFLEGLKYAVENKLNVLDHEKNI